VGDLTTLETLLQGQYLRAQDAKTAVAAAPDDRAVELFSHHINKPSEAIMFGKYLAESETIDRLVTAAPETFLNIPPEQAAEVQAEFGVFAEALEKPLDIEPIGRLATDHVMNKFVVGLDPQAKHWSLAWSNTADREYHRDIFTDLERARRATYPKEYRSGGAITVESDSEGRVIARMCHSSGDFGTYNRRLLERSHEEITTAIRAALGREDVEVVIDVSR
jgi:hypothetical protein